MPEIFIWAIAIGVAFILLLTFAVVRLTGAKLSRHRGGMSDTSPSDMNSSL